MYFEDHNPPQFHVVANEFAARVRIDDLTILNGELPTKVLARVRDWAARNRDLLESKWAEYSEE